MDVWLLQEKQVAESAVFVFSVGLDVVLCEQQYVWLHYLCGIFQEYVETMNNCSLGLITWDLRCEEVGKEEKQGSQGSEISMGLNV